MTSKPNRSELIDMLDRKNGLKRKLDECAAPLDDTWIDELERMNVGPVLAAIKKFDPDPDGHNENLERVASSLRVHLAQFEDYATQFPEREVLILRGLIEETLDAIDRWYDGHSEG